MCRPLFSGIIIALVIAGITAAQERYPIGHLGDLELLEIRGAATFTPAEIKQALFSNFEFLLASHPSAPLWQYQTALSDRIRGGYLRAGFADARVHAQIDSNGERVVVTVQEGPRFSMGQIHITGCRTIDPKRLAALVTRPRPKIRPGAGDLSDPKKTDDKQRTPETDFWEPGKPAQFDEAAQQANFKAIGKAVNELGYHSTKYKVDLPRDAARGVADLRIDILDEGSAPRIDRIECVGNRRDPAEQIIECLALAPGMLFDDAQRERISRKLEETARYLDYKLNLSDPSGKNGERVLRIELKEFSKAPPLAQPLSREEQALLKVGEWSHRFAEGDSDLVCTIVRGQRVFELIFAPREGTMLVELAEQADKQLRPVRGLVHSATVEAISVARGRRLAVTGPGWQALTHLYLNAMDDPDEPEKTSHFTWGFAINQPDELPQSARPPHQMTFAIRPAAALALAWQSNTKLAWTGDVLELRSSKRRLRIDSRNGALLEDVEIGDDGSTQFVLRVRQGAYRERYAALTQAGAHLPNSYDPARPVSSVLGFLVDEAISISPDLPASSQESLPVIRKLVSPRVLEPIDQLVVSSLQNNEHKSAFMIPPSNLEPSGAVASFASLAMVMNDKLFLRNTWPWTLVREATFQAVGKGKYSQAELERVSAAADCGPLGCLAAGEALKLLNPAAARRFGQRGLQRMTIDDFRNDYRMLLDPRCPAGQLLLRAAEVARVLEPADIAVLRRMSQTKAGAANEEEWSPELARLATLFSSELKRHGNRPIEEAAGLALDHLWEHGLREAVAAALTRLRDHGVIKLSERPHPAPQLPLRASITPMFVGP